LYLISAIIGLMIHNLNTCTSDILVYTNLF